LNINKLWRFRFYRLEGVESFADRCVLISNFCDFCEVAVLVYLPVAGGVIPFDLIKLPQACNRTDT
jgi:hypothetical protein